MKESSLILICLFLSILVNAQIQKLSVYPNPASGHVTITLNSETNAKYTLSVVDMIGRVKVMENILVGEGFNQRKIDLDNFVKGLYMVVIHADGKNDQAVRLIVE